MDRGRVAALFVTAVLLAVVAWDWWPRMTGQAPELLGIDFDMYVEATRRWLDGGPFYRPEQLVGPYAVALGDVLYPPPMLLLFLPWALGAPALLWWLVPAVIVGWGLWRLRPDPRWWPLMVLPLLWPNTLLKVVTGNPSMWLAAALTVGCLTAGPAVLMLMKPTLLPFAVIGIRERRWWMWLAGLAAVCVAFLPLWQPFVASLLNARHPAGPFYSLGEVPMFLVVVTAWVGRLRGNRPIGERAVGVQVAGGAGLDPVDLQGHVVRGEVGSGVDRDRGRRSPLVRRSRVNGNRAQRRRARGVGL